MCVQMACYAAGGRGRPVWSTPDFRYRRTHPECHTVRHDSTPKPTAQTVLRLDMLFHQITVVCTSLVPLKSGVGSIDLSRR